MYCSIIVQWITVLQTFSKMIKVIYLWSIFTFLVLRECSQSGVNSLAFTHPIQLYSISKARGKAQRSQESSSARKLGGANSVDTSSHSTRQSTTLHADGYVEYIEDDEESEVVRPKSFFLA
jgi:hypothetical protein